MIRRSREMNVFSMSALDLFASALGAFILISLVLFPSFPNLSPDVVVAPPSPEPVPEPAPPQPQLPDLDLVIVLDVTGSMGGVISALKAEIDQLIQIVVRMTPSLGVGVVAFGDRAWGGQSIFALGVSEITGSTVNQEALRAFVDRLYTNMGCRVPGRCFCPYTEHPQCENGTDPEDFLRALREATEMNWRSGSERRVIVMITDNPAYREEQEQAVAHARSFRELGGGRSVSTVYQHTGQSRLPRGDIEAFLRRVAGAGGGQYVPQGASTTGMILTALM